MAATDPTGDITGDIAEAQRLPMTDAVRARFLQMLFAKQAQMSPAPSWQPSWRGDVNPRYDEMFDGLFSTQFQGPPEAQPPAPMPLPPIVRR